MSGRRPGSSGLDTDFASPLESSPPPVGAHPGNSYGAPRRGVNPALQDLLGAHSLDMDTTRRLAVELLGWESFCIGISDGIVAQNASAFLDLPRLVRQFVLADAYDRRWDILPSYCPSLEHRPGIDPWGASLIEDQLCHASGFRDALASAVCGSIQYPSHTQAPKNLEKDRWLQFHQLRDSPSSVHRYHTGVQFAHLLMLTLERVAVERSVEPTLHKLAIRWPLLREALALLQWDMGSAVRSDEAAAQAQRPASESVSPIAKDSWIEFQLVDDDDKPIVGERYEVLLPNQTLVTGTLPESGTVFLEGIPHGQCEVSFPSLGTTSLPSSH